MPAVNSTPAQRRELERQQRDIAAAIVEGFRSSGRPTRQHAARPAIVIDVEGHPDPIIVLVDDVLIPSSFPSGIGAGIRLDVTAILSGR